VCVRSGVRGVDNCFAALSNNYCTEKIWYLSSKITSRFKNMTSATSDKRWLSYYYFIFNTSITNHFSNLVQPARWSHIFIINIVIALASTLISTKAFAHLQRADLLASFCCRLLLCAFTNTCTRLSI
jgi:hypothetical protein